MAVFRVEKKNNFTIMSNHHLRDNSLSLKARGLLSVMLSLPETWDYTLKGLTKICKEGIDSVTQAVHELEKAGYVKKDRVRNELGQLKGTDYIVREIPVKEDCEYYNASNNTCETTNKSETYFNHINTTKVDTFCEEEYYNNIMNDYYDSYLYDNNSSSENNFSESGLNTTSYTSQRASTSEINNPVLENPVLETPVLENPVLENPVQLNIYNKLNTNKANTNHIYPVIYRSQKGSSLTDKTDVDSCEYFTCRDNVKAYIGYDYLMHDTPNRDIVNEIVELLTETLLTNSDTIHVAKHDYPASMVKARMQRLTQDHIEYVLAKTWEAKDVKNVKSYLLTMLFNAPATMDTYTRAVINSAS